MVSYDSVYFSFNINEELIKEDMKTGGVWAPVPILSYTLYTYYVKYNNVFCLEILSYLKRQ